eukprot:2522308-Pleurochrysis_carterae.AAC.2
MRAVLFLGASTLRAQRRRLPNVLLLCPSARRRAAERAPQPASAAAQRKMASPSLLGRSTPPLGVPGSSRDVGVLRSL